MFSSNRIGALEIAEALSELIGSYVDIHSIEFLAVEDESIHCWYQHSLDDGPVFHIEMVRTASEWSLHLNELPPGATQQIEMP
jgi:hypothetical protein